MPLHVLGISAFYHDAAACLLRDGEVVLAVEEERLSRVKHDATFPHRAIAACLAAGGIGPADVDALVFYEKPLPKLERQLDATLRRFPRSLASFVRSMSRYLEGRLDLRRWLERRTGVRGEVLFSEHHLSHAAFAFHSSPFPAARVLVTDGVGEWATTSLWSADDRALTVEREVHFPASLGLFYSIVTAHLGFRVNEDEYKVMGLAAYGEDTFAREVAAMLPFRADGSFGLEPSLVDLTGASTACTPALRRLLGPPRAPGEPIEERHRNLARSAQDRLEAALGRLVADLAPGEPLCVSGGVALNAVANGRLASARPLHVPFAAGDSGAAIGAALVAHHAMGGARARVTTPFLGPSFAREDCAAAARRADLRARPLASLGGDAAVAHRLARGAIVGWFDGPMEFGPRALGHRSILADPRSAAMRDVVNARIKHREAFRPFAPAVPAERAREYFDVDHAVPWMTEVHAVRPATRDAIAAVVHVDGTGRLQTVDRHALPRLHALLEAFERLSGVPVLLNTSFNVAGEPIVCTPEDACRTFRSADLDGLVLGDLWIEKGGA